MKKSEIQFHSGGYRPAHPAVNVKRYSWPRAEAIAARFRCSEKTAEKASGIAWEWACGSFWEEVQGLADRYLGTGYKVYSEGRSSGWLVVHGLPDVETWDGLRVSRWGNFARAVQEDINYRASLESVCDSIEANDLCPADALLDDPAEEAIERAHWEARDTVTIST